ncbi:MAG: hypothetical protein ACREPI_04875 [Candidatus Dormibacterales bacterium]
MSSVCPELSGVPVGSPVQGPIRRRIRDRQEVAQVGGLARELRPSPP